MDTVAPVKASLPYASTARVQPPARPQADDTLAPRPVEPVQQTDSASNQTSAPPQESEFLRKVLQQIDARLPVNVNLDIYVDEEAKRTVVRGVSKVTGETVIEWPTDEMLNLIRGIREDLGIAVDTTA